MFGPTEDGNSTSQESAKEQAAPDLPDKKLYLAGNTSPRAYYLELWISEQYALTRAAYESGKLKTENGKTDEGKEKQGEYLAPNTLLYYSRLLHQYAAYVYEKKVEPTIVDFTQDEDFLSQANLRLNREIVDRGGENVDEFLRHIDETQPDRGAAYRTVLKHLYRSLIDRKLSDFTLPAREYYRRSDDLPDIAPISFWAKKILTLHSPASAKNQIRYIHQFLYFVSTSKLLHDEKVDSITDMKDGWPEELEEQFLLKPETHLQQYFKEVDKHYSSGTTASIRSCIRKLYKWLKDEGYTEFDFHKWEQPFIGERLPQHQIFQLYARYLTDEKSENTAKDYVRTLARFLKDQAARSGMDTKDENFGQLILNLSVEEIHAAIRREREKTSTRMGDKLGSVLKSFYGTLSRRI